ncbi:MAG: hypothetical protein IKI58_11730 [Oscillospiraceae bacterium]|nr:hypothetical protein [Oscillospiraceae bacterium]
MLRVFLALLCNLLLNGLVFGGAAAYFRSNRLEEETRSRSRAFNEQNWKVNVICFLAIDCICVMIAAALTKHVLPMIFLIPLLWFLCGFLQLRVLEPIIRSKLKANFYRNKQ